MLRNSLILLALLLFTGCSHTRISNFDKYSHMPISDVRNMPTDAVIKNGRTVPKISIKNFTNHTNIRNAETIVSTSISNFVAENINAIVIDRDITSKLGDELTLSKSLSQSPQKAQIVEEVNFVIRGEILSADVTKQFTQGHYTYRTNKKGEQIADWNEPSTYFTITTSGIVELLSLPNARTIVTTNVSGKVSKSYSGNVTSTPSDLIKESLIAFSSKAFDTVEKNFNTSAFVSELKSMEDDFLVKITAGKKQKLREGDAIAFLSQDLELDALTRETSNSEQVVASGLVSSIILDNYAWVIVESSDIPKIRRGMIVRTQK